MPDTENELQFKQLSYWAAPAILIDWNLMECVIKVATLLLAQFGSQENWKGYGIGH